MKNLPYYKGGTCKKVEYNISFSGNLKKLKFETFEDFCERADEILYTYTKYKNQINFMAYKTYIYKHKFCDNETLDNALKDKCFEWIMSIDYEPLEKNVLYGMLGKMKKEKKK